MTRGQITVHGAAVLLAWLCVSASRVDAATLSVGDDGRGVQETIDAASDGDVVEVPAGTWPAHAVVNKRVTLRGTGGVLDGGGEGTVITIAAAGAIVEGLTVRGSGENLLGRPDCGIYLEPEATGAIVRDNRIEDSTFGIWIHETEGAQLLDNRIFGRSQLRPTERGNGIQLFNGSRLVVRGNHVTGARDGIYVSAVEDSLIESNITVNQRYGVHYMFSYRNTLRGNRSSDNLSGFALMESGELVVEDNRSVGNERHGILFRDAQHCKIRRNLVERNGQGLFFFSSTDNEIVNNRIVHNEIGAKVWAGSVRNRVSQNAFIGNRRQVFYVGHEDMIFGDQSPGNYWSDYVGWDQNNDGLGDRPYRMNSFTSTLVYRYPQAALLMHSPAMELLSHLESKFPLLTVATVVDQAPVVRPSDQ